MAKGWSDEEVIQMYTTTSMSLSRICAELGCYTPQIYAVLDKHNIPRRTKVKRAIETPGEQLRLEDSHEPRPVTEGWAEVDPEDRAKAWRPIDPDGILELVQAGAIVQEDIPDDVMRKVLIDYMLRNRTAKDLAIEFDVPYNKMLKKLRDAGVQVVPGRPARKYGALRRQITADLVTSEETGLTIAQIAIKRGVSLAVVEKIARRIEKFQKVFQASQWGKTEALIEEVKLRVLADLQNRSPQEVQAEQEERQGQLSLGL